MLTPFSSRQGRIEFGPAIHRRVGERSMRDPSGSLKTHIHIIHAPRRAALLALGFPADSSPG
jgi:hypothetical protein